jgi:hypothetical protein
VTAAVVWRGRGGVVSRRANVLLMCLQWTWASIAALERRKLTSGAGVHEVTFDDDARQGLSFTARKKQSGRIAPCGVPEADTLLP